MRSFFLHRRETENPNQNIDREAAERLSFELLVRENTVKAAKSLYFSEASFATFYHSRCNSKYWLLTREGGFELKANAAPAEAIRDIFTNGAQYAFECATAMVIVLYRAVLDTLGDTVFNRLFSNLYLWDWHFDFDLRLTWNVPQAYYPGDIRYFKNPEVDPKTPYWQGENVVDLGGGLYYGHGLGIRSAKEMIAALNQRRRPGATRSAYLMDEAARPGYAYLSQFTRHSQSEDALNMLRKTKVTIVTGQHFYVD